MIIQIYLTSNDNLTQHLIFEFIGNSKLTTKQDFKDLIESLRTIKNDWYTMNCGTHMSGFYINLHLFYFEKTNWSEVNQIKQLLEKVCLNEMIDIDYYDLIPESTVFISIDDNINCDIDINTISTILNKNKIDFIINLRDSNDYESGAGHWFEDFSMFIISSVASGITYDYIKGILYTLPTEQIRGISCFIFDKMKFKMLRNEVANRIGCDPKTLLLKHYKKNRFSDTYIFLFKNQKVVVKASRRNRIKKIDVN